MTFKAANNAEYAPVLEVHYGPQRSYSVRFKRSVHHPRQLLTDGHGSGVWTSVDRHDENAVVLDEITAVLTAYEQAAMEFVEDTDNACCCVCGNEPCDQGHYPCDEYGELREPDEGWTDLYRCANCGRVWHSPDGLVVGRWSA